MKQTKGTRPKAPVGAETQETGRVLGCLDTRTGFLASGSAPTQIKALVAEQMFQVERARVAAAGAKEPQILAQASGMNPTNSTLPEGRQIPGEMNA